MVDDSDGEKILVGELPPSTVKPMREGLDSLIIWDLTTGGEMTQDGYSGNVPKDDYVDSSKVLNKGDWEKTQSGALSKG